MKAVIDKKEMLRLRLDGRTYQYIADVAGVRRQRIQQILSPPPAVRDCVVWKYHGLCAKCGIYVGKGGQVHHNEANGEEDYHDRENLLLLCMACHRREHAKPPQFQCRRCGVAIRKGIFCDWSCFRKYHEATLTCSYCGGIFILTTSSAYKRTERSRSGLIFCCNRCQGKWLGENHGPERKYDYERVYKARDETGFGAPRLSSLLGIPISTIGSILRKQNRYQR